MQDSRNAEERGEIVAMRALAAGNDAELNGIIDRWSARLTALLFRMTGNAATAAELAQETFVRLYLTRHRFRSGASARPFSTWLFGIAANLARNHLRWRRRHPEATLDDAPEPCSGDDPLKSAKLRELGEIVRRAVAALPADLREALVLSEYENLSQVEIASISGCSVKAVERRLARARETLRRSLSPYLKDGSPTSD